MQFAMVNDKLPKNAARQEIEMDPVAQLVTLLEVANLNQLSFRQLQGRREIFYAKMLGKRSSTYGGGRGRVHCRRTFLEKRQRERAESSRE
mmetsp:Transcript_16527/g.67879  ORF Transcript_16527/g.67879 Transcript_16527/m.67879 type:complete len:91 (+) Transcript_16527:572-844(+)